MSHIKEVFRTASFLAQRSTLSSPVVNIIVDPPSSSRGGESASVASFLAEKTTDAGALPKVDVVMEAPDTPASSTDHMTATMRASEASTSVALFGEEALAVMSHIKEVFRTASFLAQRSTL